MKSSNQWLNRTEELRNKGLIEDQQAAVIEAMFSGADEESAEIGKLLIRLKVSEILLEGLNSGQKYAFLKVIDFFESQTYDALLIKGYAGTGKTFLTRKIIEYITTAYPKAKVALTAPTNKAVHVLAKNSPFRNNSQIFEDYGKVETLLAYCTIYKFLGLKEQVDTQGKRKFVSEKSGSSIDDYQYLINDEVSMLEDDRFEDIMEHRKKIKIIFMGDPLQIPPIGKVESKVFSTNHPYKILVLNLTEIMRQKGAHPVVDLGMLMRQNIKQRTPIKTPQSILNEVGDGVIYIDYKKSNHHIKPLIKKLYKAEEYDEDPEYVKIIAYQNTTVRYMNSIVRTLLFGEKKSVFEIGERIIANKPLWEAKENKWGTYYSIKANTSDEFKVMKAEVVERTITDKYSKKIPKVVFKGLFWKLTVFNPRDVKRGLITIFVIHEKSRGEYQKLVREWKAIATDKKDIAYWTVYYNILKYSDDISYNYAITAHKAQGSDYKHVIFIQMDLKSKNIYENNRIIYTTYGRCVNRLYIIK